jgi:SAM-dependent methyltransferase
MDFRDYWWSGSSFILKNNVFYQRGVDWHLGFEKSYIELRKKEGRLYSDEDVQHLPGFHGLPSLVNEWNRRKITMNKLIKYLSKKEVNGQVLELGCGNGWLAHQLAVSLGTEVWAIDTNEIELLQGAKLFNTCKNLIFVHADIFTAEIKRLAFNIILLAGSIQYFPNLKLLFDRLFELLTPSGEIHIVDTPFYESVLDSQDAKRRSGNYYESLGQPDMVNKYFHHTFFELKDFEYEILFDPGLLVSIFRRKILMIPQMAFPWILVKHA